MQSSFLLPGLIQQAAMYYNLLVINSQNDSFLLQKHLSPEKNFGSSKKIGLQEDQSIPGGRIKLKLHHVNINCHEDGTGYTPLIIAVLNGLFIYCVKNTVTIIIVTPHEVMIF